MIDYEKLILDRINRVKKWPCCRPLENDDLEGFIMTAFDGNEYICQTAAFGDTQYISLSKGSEGICLYLVNLETGMVAVESDETLPGGKHMQDRANLSDVKGGILARPLVIINEPVIIDATQPPVQEMSWEEIAKTIISEMTNPENLHHWDEEESK